MKTAAPFSDWIRPWYPAGAIGHTRPDCPTLLAIQPTPAEGSGWLVPRRGQVCDPCLRADGYPFWNATCHTCKGSLADEKAGDDTVSYFTTREEATRWRREHRCEPHVSLIPPEPAAPPQPANQPALFALESAA